MFAIVLETQKLPSGESASPSGDLRAHLPAASVLQEAPAPAASRDGAEGSARCCSAGPGAVRTQPAWERAGGIASPALYGSRRFCQDVAAVWKAGYKSLELFDVSNIFQNRKCDGRENLLL